MVKPDFHGATQNIYNTHGRKEGYQPYLIFRDEMHTPEIDNSKENTEGRGNEIHLELRGIRINNGQESPYTHKSESALAA